MDPTNSNTSRANELLAESMAGKEYVYPTRANAEANGTRIKTEGDTRTVETNRGLLQLSQLDVFEVRDEGPNHTAVGREYYLGQELVKRDAWVSLLRGLSAEAEPGKFG